MMNKKTRKKIEKVEILSSQENKKIKTSLVQETKPLLEALKAWRRDSLASNMRI